MSKNIVYVASCTDMASGEKLGSSKVGIATSDADKRIRALNSTKQPISVELEAAWSFEHSPLTAEIVEAAIHALLDPERVNGEWFRDPEGDLADRVGKAIRKLGGIPVGDENEELAEMNDRQREALERMKAVFEPMRSKLDELGVTWEYMTWLVGIDSGIGRMKVRVTKNSGLYLVKGASTYSASELRETTGLKWRDGESPGRVMCNNATSEELLHFLEAVRNLEHQQPSLADY